MLLINQLRLICLIIKRYRCTYVAYSPGSSRKSYRSVLLGLIKELIIIQLRKVLGVLPNIVTYQLKAYSIVIFSVLYFTLIQ